jgi:hypothetical protein
MRPSTYYIPLILIILFTTQESCEEESVPIQSGSYFPLDEGKEWEYVRWIRVGLDEPPGFIMDTLSLHVGYEVKVDGRTYKSIVDPEGNVDKLVRVEGSKYLARQHELYQNDYSHEYVFLDTDKAVGESWAYIKDGGYSKTKYTIEAKRATHTYNGLVYKNVIKVRVNYYYRDVDGNFEHAHTVFHYYAPGVGEIYNFYPYPISSRYGDVSSFISNDK